MKCAISVNSGMATRRYVLSLPKTISPRLPRLPSTPTRIAAANNVSAVNTGMPVNSTSTRAIRMMKKVISIERAAFDLGRMGVGPLTLARRRQARGDAQQLGQRRQEQQDST